MKKILILLLTLSPTLTYSQTKTEIFIASQDTSINQYTSNSSFEWKTSNEETILHFIEYNSDGEAITKMQFEVLSIEDDNISVIIKVKGKYNIFNIHFWKDHSQVIYKFKNRYSVITGNLKF